MLSKLIWETSNGACDVCVRTCVCARMCVFQRWVQVQCEFQSICNWPHMQQIRHDRVCKPQWKGCLGCYFWCFYYSPVSAHEMSHSFSHSPIPISFPILILACLRISPPDICFFRCIFQFEHGISCSCKKKNRSGPMQHTLEMNSKKNAKIAKIKTLVLICFSRVIYKKKSHLLGNVLVHYRQNIQRFWTGLKFSK